MNATKQTSNREIQQILMPRIDALNKKTVYAEYEDPSLPPILYRQVVNEKGLKSKTHPDTTKSNDTLCLHFRFLGNIRDNSNDGLASHYRLLSVGIEKGNRLLKDLKKLGYVLIHEVPSNNPNGGRPCKVPSLTPEGKKALEAYEARS